MKLAAMKSALKPVAKKMRDGVLTMLPMRAGLRLEFWLSHGRLPELANPRTFNEKIQRRKMVDRDPRLAPWIDKITAKEQAAALLGTAWVVPTLWSGSALPPRAERTWPTPYVLKASHGSGWNRFVKSGADLHWDAIERETDGWLRSMYGAATREWAYRVIAPRLLVEPYLDAVATNPDDYKLFVFGGKVACIQVDSDRYGDHRQSFYDLDWKRLPFEYAAPGPVSDVPRPRSLQAMIAGAEKLGEGFDFVRVDLYEIDGTPRFGEMTFYPNAGRTPFTPLSADAELGELWPG